MASLPITEGSSEARLVRGRQDACLLEVPVRRGIPRVSIEGWDAAGQVGPDGIEMQIVHPRVQVPRRKKERGASRRIDQSCERLSVPSKWNLLIEQRGSTLLHQSQDSDGK